MSSSNYLSQFGNKFTFFYTAVSPFSQHHQSSFKRNGVKYTCAEQYMMHQKAVIFGDTDIAAEILAAEKPGRMKSLGRKVRNFDDDKWKKNRERIIHEGSVAKFSQNPDLMKALMETRGTYMVEASPRDCLYGIGLGADNPKARDPKNWRGKNLLGRILTDVREELIAQASTDSTEGEGGNDDHPSKREVVQGQDHDVDSSLPKKRKKKKQENHGGDV